MNPIQENRRPPAKYFMALGVRPDARAAEVAASYYQLRMQLEVDGATDERREQLDHCFRILRSYFRQARRTYRSRLPRPASTGRRGLGLALLAGLLFAAMLVLPDLGASIRYEPGDVLFFKEDSAAFGVVVGYDAAHRFAAGRPVAAYEVRLAGSADRVWISRRRVDGGMRKGGALPPSPRAAS